ncbi:MAG: hypothetical protein GX456_16035 [Verrucomicrobia bacterium]|nr:hypothetical protein [Verrucomicrobiota bacterium]
MKSCVSQGGRSAHTTNKVSVPISACGGLPHRPHLPRIGTRDSQRAMPQSEGKTQTTSLSLYLGPRPNNEPGTLSRHEKPSERGVLERAQNSQTELCG